MKYIADEVYSRYNTYPKFKIRSLNISSGDEDEVVYSLTFYDDSGNEMEDEISLIHTDDGKWLWDNDVYDRTHILNEAVDTYVETLDVS